MVVVLSPLLYGLGIYGFYVLKGDENLKFHIEGMMGRTNFRDVGESVNQCLGDQFLKEDRLFRAKRQFSGWSCSSVGAPDKIYSLNHDHKKPRSYYCWQGTQIKKGIVLNSTRFDDAEFIKNWHEDAHIRETSCQYLERMMADLINQEKILMHCDAGRDRTGALSALLAGLVLEDEVEFKSLNSALECDYRKSKNLSQSFYGRIQTFHEDIVSQYRSIELFLLDKCKNISARSLTEFQKEMKFTKN